MLSDDPRYPLQGDTWYDGKGKPLLTVLYVTGAGKIVVCSEVNAEGHFVLSEARTLFLESFEAKLRRMGLTIPSTCTREYLDQLRVLALDGIPEEELAK